MRRTSVAGPLTAALLAAALLTGLAAIAYQESTQSLTDEAHARVQSNRDAAIRALTRQADDAKRTVAAYASQPAVQTALQTPTPATLRGASADLALLAKAKDLPAVFLSDATGRAVAIYPPQPALLGTDFSFRDWYQGARRTGAPYVSAVYRSVAPGQPLAVAVATPVTAGSRRVGYLTIVGSLEVVRSVAEGARQDGGVLITITDQTGQPITDQLALDDRGRPRGEAVTAQALRGRSVTTVDDRDLLSAGPVPSTGWTVSASLPKSTALAPARTLRNSLAISLGASLALLAVVTVLALRAARRRSQEHDVIDVERGRLAALFAASPIGILESLPDTTIVNVNDAMASMLGYLPNELIGMRGIDLFAPAATADVTADIGRVMSGTVDSYTRERVYQAKDGTLVPTQVSVIVLRQGDGSVRRIVAFLVDLREQKRVEQALRASEDRLTQLALHDELTGLPNRRLLFTRCRDAFDQARVSGGTVAALFIDLDGFKAVNDRHGHERGDQLLVDIAADLRAAFPEDTVARVGGDEFVVLLTDGHASLDEAATQATTAVRRQVGRGAHALTVTASVGVATIDVTLEPEARPDELLSRADTAMYAAKERGRDRHESFRGPAGDAPAPASTSAATLELPGPRPATKAVR